VAKILIVDDDNAVQATIRLLLERAGHSVVVAEDGRKGLRYSRPEISICCSSISSCREWTGWKPCGLVHQQQPLIPIIVISGNPMTFGVRLPVRIS